MPATLITFPRDLPDELTIVGMAFPPQPMQTLTPLRSGKVIAHDIGPTLWRPSWRSDRMTPDEAGAVRAFYDTVLSTGQFYGFDKLREFPLAYATGWGALQVGGAPFDGTCALESVSSAALVALKGLPIGFVFSRGDYLAFDYAGGASRALHRVVAGDTADGDGEVTVEVRPYVRPGWAADATVMLHRAAARMLILPETYTEQEEAPWFTTISFDAIQTL